MRYGIESARGQYCFSGDAEDFRRSSQALSAKEREDVGPVERLHSGYQSTYYGQANSSNIFGCQVLCKGLKAKPVKLLDAEIQWPVGTVKTVGQSLIE